MKDARRELGFLLKHSTIYGLGNLLSKAVAILLLPLYTRHLTPADYGVMELLETSTSMLAVVVGVGLSSAMTRYYYEARSDDARRHVVSTTMLLVIIMSAVVLGGASLFTPLLSQAIFGDSKYAYFFLMSFGALGLGLVIDLLLVYLRVMEKPLAYVAISLAMLVTTVALTVYAVAFRGMGVEGVLLANLYAKVAFAGAAMVYMVMRIGCVLDRAVAKSIFSYSWPLIPSEAINSLIGYSDRYFINHHISLAAAGVYSLTQKLGTVLHTLVTSPFILAFLPKRFEIASRGNAAPLLSMVYQVYMLVIVTLTLCLALGASLIVGLLTDSAFHEAAKYIPLTAASMVLLGMKYHFQFGILYSKKTKYIMYTNAICLVVQLGGNALLIPAFGVWGAINAYMITQVVTLYFYHFYSQREYPVDLKLAWTLRLFVAATIPYLLKAKLSTGSVVSEVFVSLGALGLFVALTVAFRVLSVSQFQEMIGRLRSLISPARVRE